jgi:hypothetical protein
MALRSPHWNGHAEAICLVPAVPLRVRVFAYGEKLDESKLKRLGPGSVILEPRDTLHHFITKDEEVLLQIVAEGPFTTKYVQ